MGSTLNISGATSLLDEKDIYLYMSFSPNIVINIVKAIEISHERPDFLSRIQVFQDINQCLLDLPRLPKQVTHLPDMNLNRC